MLKLMIVDDEIEIREGLLAMEWAELGLTVVKVCENGLEAYMWIRDNPVDIVLTDIRMPHMDGMELAAKLHEQFSYTKVVVLSGYDDFLYARNCIRYGVEDYLLKPVRLDQLKDTMLRCVNGLNQDKQQQMRAIMLERRSMLLTNVLRKKFIQQCTSVPVSQEEWEEGCSVGEMLLDSPPYTVCLLKFDIDLSAPWEVDKHLLAFALHNILIDLWDDKYGYHSVNDSTVEVLFLAQGEEDWMVIMTELRKQLYGIRGLFPSTFSISIGQTVNSIQDLPLSRLSADKALSSGDVDCIQVYDHKQFDPSTRQTAEPDTILLQQLQHVGPLNQTGMDVVNQGKAYIRANYNRSITLSEVADHVHVNASYLSFLFKEMSGENYIAYLTSCRIEAAKELLAETQYKVYEIGEMVGYENSRYFSQIFRKITEQTPNDYRISVRN
ncbi:response regulator [Paenibacillus sp. LMG 31461]|uniref:Response regulator n=1 Tax=Paenibacillus plantarum TaxID=2654975 RepID=A0ABX1X282_9BACL|nr:response regulator [Paenibacillus plantarum]NOU62504.1 response regulator [Paenibacillus plantarum]